VASWLLQAGEKEQDRELEEIRRDLVALRKTLELHAR
jgi:hypothetical protein